VIEAGRARWPARRRSLRPRDGRAMETTDESGWLPSSESMGWGVRLLTAGVVSNGRSDLPSAPQLILRERRGERLGVSRGERPPGFPDSGQAGIGRGPAQQTTVELAGAERPKMSTSTRELAASWTRSGSCVAHDVRVATDVGEAAPPTTSDTGQLDGPSTHAATVYKRALANPRPKPTSWRTPVR
jgi:hypothetical protein